MPPYLKPSSQFLAPGGMFVFPQTKMQELLIMFQFKSTMDRMMRQYFTSVHPIAPCCHRPTLEATYATFYDEYVTGFEPRPSTLAVICAALFSGAVAMDENEMFHETGLVKKDLVEKFKQSTEAALANSNFLRTTKLETMQAFIMYMVSGINMANLGIMS